MLLTSAASKLISIHAPHEGERRRCAESNINWLLFQSTLPTRGSDDMVSYLNNFFTEISIHAPHEGERRAKKPLSA